MRMYYKRIVILVILSLMFGCKSIAQQSGFIEFAFPGKVDELIEEHVQNQLKTKPNYSFYLVLSKEDKDVYEVFVVGYESGKGNVGEELANRSNRYFILGTNKVPVIYYMDYYFAVFGRINRKPIRKVTIHEGYSIRFKYNGDII